MVSLQEINNIGDKIGEILGEQKYLSKQLKEEKEKQHKLEQTGIDALEARTIISTVAKATQQQLEQQFNTLVTGAIQSVFEDDRHFMIEFVERRNRTEVDCWIIKGGQKIGLYDGGGGLVDLVALACRFAFWKLEGDKRPLFFLDEPFRFLHSPEYQERASVMLNTLSEQLGIQLVIVSDQEDIKGQKEFKVVDGKVREV